MIKKAITTVVAITIMLINASILSAGDGWEMSIKAELLNAGNKLTIGQKPDASDGIDGRYDVPALLAGDIKAYIDLGGDKYWKDIKESCITPCKKVWTLVIESGIKGETIKLGWEFSAISEDREISLVDIFTGEVTDMKTQGSYSYQNNGHRQFRIEVAK